MGKVVLGIVVVFVLDLAFILFLRGGGDLVELAQAIRVLSVDPAIISQELEGPEVAALDKRPSEDIYDVQVPKSGSVSLENTLRKARPQRTLSSKRVEIARKVRSQPLSTYALNEPAEAFSDTIILIEPASYTSDHQSSPVENPPSKAIEAPVTYFAPTKRSFFSRARPLVRKPYDWLKAFTTKLF